MINSDHNSDTDEEINENEDSEGRGEFSQESEAGEEDNNSEGETNDQVIQSTEYSKTEVNIITENRLKLLKRKISQH